MSAFASIQAALVAALSAAPALAAGRIYTDRARPLATGFDSAVSVRMESSSAAEVMMGALDWTTAYSVECYARATEGTDRATAVDALLTAAWLRLSAMDAQVIGAMAVTLHPQIDWQYDDADTLMGCAIIRLQVQHRTPFATLAPF